MTVEEAPAELAAEANIFVSHPLGFRTHFKLLGPAIKIVRNMELLISLLVEKGYTPEGSAPSSNTTADDEEANPACPDCGGPTEYKNGKGAKGSWAGYFCIKTKDAPQASRHKAVWI